jgi:hypothetical protein
MQELFRKYLKNQCSPEEVKQLLEVFGEDNNEDALRALITQRLETDEDAIEFDDGELRNSLAQSYSRIKSQIGIKERREVGRAIPLTKRIGYRIAAAAIVVTVILGTYLLINRPEKEEYLVKDSNGEIGPGGNIARLMLTDCTIIQLDNAKLGIIAKQGSSEIIKTSNGQIAYKSLIEKPTGVLYNLVSTPRGGQYQLEFHDGSKVWLNSASSIRFPVTFTGRERVVEITGEVYFEVARHASMPFKVEVAGKQQVEVLGTHFNINAYDDESSINTSLFEGKIRVSPSVTQEAHLMIPGQQSRLTEDGKLYVEKKRDLENVLAWKNGHFNFDGADTYTVMRIISRWYDVDVRYEGEVPQREFAGEIEKSLNLSQVLKILEKNNLRFKLEGRNLTVLH